MRKRITASLAAAVLLPFSFLSAPSAHAQTGRYVALGDSFTAGPLIPAQHGTPVGCLRSDRNYPSLVAASRGLALTDVSCSGATTKDMSSPQDVPLGTNAPQFDALTPGTELVTLGIGGNDIGYSEILLVCSRLSLTNPVGAPCAEHYGDTLDQRVADTAPKLASVLRTIHAKAPNARVLLVGYLRLLPDGPGCWPVVPIAAGDVPYLDRLERRLNAMLAAQAAGNGAAYVDAYAGGAGHDMCAEPGAKWVEGVLPTRPAFPVHPNASGMRVVADRVLSALSSRSAHAGER